MEWAPGAGLVPLTWDLAEVAGDGTGRFVPQEFHDTVQVTFARGLVERGPAKVVTSINLYAWNIQHNYVLVMCSQNLFFLLR